MNPSNRIAPLRARLVHRLAGARGAIDLASIMVGVIITGVLAGVIAAAVVCVIPWSQDKAAQQNLDSINTAESVFRATHEGQRYATVDQLNSAKLLVGGTPRVAVVTDDNGDCWVATSQSSTGRVYWSSSDDPAPQELTASSSSTCADLRSIAAPPVAVAILVHSAAEMALALANSPDGSTIQAATDFVQSASDPRVVAASRRLTFDTAGHTVKLVSTVSGDFSESYPGIDVPKGADLTLISSAEGGKLTVTPTDLFAGPGIGAAWDDNVGTVHFKSGIIQTDSSVISPGIGVLGNAGDGTQRPAIGEGGRFLFEGATVISDVQRVLDMGAFPGVAAIGSGSSSGIDLEVRAGTVTATGYGGAAAVNQGLGGLLKVSGGVLSASRNDDFAPPGAPAICSGWVWDFDPTATTLAITGGTVNASVSTTPGQVHASAIGDGGMCSQGPAPTNVSITGGAITTTYAIDSWTGQTPIGALPGFAHRGTAWNLNLGHYSVNGISY